MTKKKRTIVSSRHLATEEGWALSEIEFGLTVLHNAFHMWIERCAAAAGAGELSAIDLLVLHNVNHRSTQKRRLDISFMLNIEDAHIVNYVLKKLAKQGLLEKEKRGKEIFYSTSAKGKQLCTEYGKVREECLVSGLKMMGMDNNELSKHAQLLRSLSGLYNQAARAAASL